MDKAVEIASKIHDSMEVARRLFGDRYDSMLKPWCLALKQRMADKKANELEAATIMLKELPVAVPDLIDRDVATLWILAAAGELITGATPSIW